MTSARTSCQTRQRALAPQPYAVLAPQLNRLVRPNLELVRLEGEEVHRSEPSARAGTVIAALSDAVASAHPQLLARRTYRRHAAEAVAGELTHHEAPEAAAQPAHEVPAGLCLRACADAPPAGPRQAIGSGVEEGVDVR